MNASRPSDRPGFFGIHPERIEPGHPEQNGRHERMHKTLIVSTVGFALGLTCLTGGVVLYVTEPAPTRLGRTPSFTALDVKPKRATRAGQESFEFEAA